MSSQPGPEFIGLAPEIVEMVIKQVSKRRDLANVRLACKTLEKHAAKELFKDVFVSPSEEHMSSWNSIGQHDIIRQIPRHAIIQTQPDIRDYGLGTGTDRGREEIGDDFEGALAAMSKFPNLNSVEIAFTPECVGVHNHDYQDVAEDISQREEMLRLIFQAIQARAADKENRTIRNLTIVNLQNCPIPEFTSSDLFRDVMSQLEQLHISFTHEYNEHGPDHDHTKIELQTFPAYLCSHWLEPISANLKALSLGHRNQNWGPYPGYFDPSGISFPNLEMLSLNYYTLAHDNDFDWVLAIKSLHKLVLNYCMIASVLRIGHQNMTAWKVQTRDWTKMPESGRCALFTYAGTWSRCLDRIAEELPNLVDFRCGEGSYAYERYGNKVAKVSTRRYVRFDNEALPTHSWRAEDDGTIERHFLVTGVDNKTAINKHEENLEADQKSMDALLEKLRLRR